MTYLQFLSVEHECFEFFQIFKTNIVLLSRIQLNLLLIFTYLNRTTRIRIAAQFALKKNICVTRVATVLFMVSE